MARLLEFYKKEVVARLKKHFGYKSVMEVPRLKKITLNMGLGEAMDDKKVITSAMADMEKIPLLLVHTPVFDVLVVPLSILQALYFLKFFMESSYKILASFVDCSLVFVCK